MTIQRQCHHDENKMETRVMTAFGPISWNMRSPHRTSSTFNNHASLSEREPVIEETEREMTSGRAAIAQGPYAGFWAGERVMVSGASRRA